MLQSSAILRLRKSAPNSALNRLSLTSKIFLLMLLTSGVLWLVRGANSAAKSSPPSKGAITIQAAGRGKPFLNFQDGRQVSVNFHGNENATQALQSGQARARALATADLDGNATPDLVVGYAYGGGGIVTVQRGNPDAFAPNDDSVFGRTQQGYNPDALLPNAQTYQVPEPVDFIQAGDFNHDNRKDVLVATRGGDLFLLAGDGQGGLRAPEQIYLPGTVTTVAAGEFRAADGQPDVAVAVNGPNGSRLLIYDGADGGLTATPMQFALANEATAVQFGGMDSDPFMDIAVAAGNEIDILHGWGRKFSPSLESRAERVNAPSEVRGMALGRFIWDRNARQEIAVMGTDGTVSILQPDGLETQPFTEAELFMHNRGRFKPQIKINDDVEATPGWKSGDSGKWTAARTVVTSAVASDVAPQSLLTTTNVSSRETEDVVVAGSRNELNIVRQIDPQANAKNAVQAAVSTTGDMAEVSLGAAEAPVAVLQLPTKLNGGRDLVVLQAQSSEPTIVPLVATSITVDRFDDPNGVNLAAASVCNGALANDCSLRGAVQFANIAINSPTTINLPAGTYTLATNGTSSSGCEGNTVGDLGINLSTNIVGASAATTIIRQHGTNVGGGTPGDRVMCLNENFLANLTYNISAVTIIGGRDFSGGGGGIIGGEQGNNLNITNAVVANNQSTGAGQGGGGILIQGGNLTITTSTIGGTNNPGVSRDDVTLGNSMNISGGGISYGSGLVSLPCPCVGTFTSQTTSTFSHNTSASATAGGGGLDLLAFNGGTGSANINGTTFSNNQATGTASGGGMILESTLVTTITTTSFTSNSAGNKGGGVFTAGGTLSLDGTSPSVTFSGNTATVSASSLGANAPVTVAGNNFSIDGSIDVLTNGSWTDNTGSTLSLTNINVFGTFNNNNSTLNISGNLLVGIETAGNPGGKLNLNTGTVNLQGDLTVNDSTLANPNNTQFNGGTSSFNFTGSGAQSINGTGPGTTVFNFANLTVNKSNTLTANRGASVVGGNLTVTAGTFDLLGNTFNRTVNGGTLTVSNGATLKIGGTNTLPSNYATHAIGATSTIEYEGTTQTVTVPNSSQNYGNLILSGSSTKTLGGGIGVSSALTINGGTLDASASNFNIDIAGNWVNNLAAANFNPRAATVTFSSTTGAQSIGGTAASQTFNNITVNKSGQTLSVGGSTTTLTLNGTMLLSAGTFSAGTAANVNIAGNWTNNVGASAFTPGTGTVTFNSTTATQSINGTAASQTFNNLTSSKSGQILNTGGSTTQLDLNGAFNLSAGTFTAPATLNVAGDWTEATGTIFTPGAGTVTFNGSGARNLNGTAATQIFNDLVINKTGGGSVTGGGSTTTLTINGGVTLTAGTLSAGTVGQIGISGDWTNNGGTFTPTSSTVLFQSGAAPQSITGTAATQTFNNITVLKSAQTLNVAGSTTTLNLNGTMNMASGIFDVNTAASVNVGGNWTLDNTATFTSGGGTNTVTLNGAGAQSLNGSSTTQTFNNFTVNKTAGTLSGGGSLATLTVNKDFTITQGTFAPGATLLTINESGGNWSNSGTFTAGVGTVVFNANAVAQSLSGSTTFNNLTINHTGAGNVDASGSTLAVSGLLRVQSGTFISSSTFNNVQIDSGQTLQGSNGTTMSVSGNWTNNGTFTANGNTVLFNGNGTTQTISGTNSFFNLTINHTGAGSVTAAGSTLAVTGLLEVQGGTLTSASSFNNVQIDSGGTLAGTNATTMDISGNWTLNTGGVFTPNGNTVSFNGPGVQTIGGTTVTTFSGLTINNGAGVTLGQNESVTGLLTLTTGILDTGVNTLSLGSAATLARTSGYVNGNLKKTFGGAGSFTYALGTANGYSPVDVTVNAGTGDFTIKAVQGNQPTLNAGTSLQRYWTLTATGFTADLVFHYLDGDVAGNEVNYRIIRVSGGTAASFPNSCPNICVDTAGNTGTIKGLNSFSDWTLGEPVAPTATNASVSGRIVDTNGNPVEGAAVRMDGTQNRLTVTDAQGNYDFENVETNGLYTVTPSRANFIFSPSQRSFSQLGQHTDAAFTASYNGGTVNPLDTTEYFVRQQYLDFLGREPEEGGFTSWVNEINNCPAGSTSCDRVHASEMFFRSPEFQQRGYYIYRFYSAAFGRKPDYAEFTPDMARVSGFLTDQQLEAARTQFAVDFMARPAFAAKYNSLSNAAYVDALANAAQVNLGNRQALIDALNAGTQTRAQVLRQIAESGEVYQKYYIQSFVVMEYFGYLRRDPDALYLDWIDTLTQTGDSRHMVNGFVNSTEYRNRFVR